MVSISVALASMTTFCGSHKSCLMPDSPAYRQHLLCFSSSGRDCAPSKQALHRIRIGVTACIGWSRLGCRGVPCAHVSKPVCLCRATTTYLVQRRIDMLPKPLTEDICSLRAGVERLAFSVLWEITEDARIVSVRFTKSVIK